MSTTTEPGPGDLQVWYIPQVPMDPFTVSVPDVATGKTILDTISAFSKFEYDHRVKPDYTDAGGISRWESDGEGGFDWYDVEEDK